MIQTTDPSHVCMFDSVTGLAFGPVFADQDEIEDFIRWADDRGEVELRRQNGRDLSILQIRFRSERGLRAADALDTWYRRHPDLADEIELGML